VRLGCEKGEGTDTPAGRIRTEVHQELITPTKALNPVFTCKDVFECRYGYT